MGVVKLVSSEEMGVEVTEEDKEVGRLFNKGLETEEGYKRYVKLVELIQ